MSVSCCCAVKSHPVFVQNLTNVTEPRICPCDAPNACAKAGIEDFFGKTSVQSRDGAFLAISSPQYGGHGAVYVFRRYPEAIECHDTFENYQLLQILLPTDPKTNEIDPLAMFSEFGTGLSISSSGRRILVSAPQYDLAKKIGRVYVFDLVGCNQCFSQTNVLQAQQFTDGGIQPDTNATGFGVTIALSADGCVAAVSTRVSEQTTDISVYTYACEKEVSACYATKNLIFAQKTTYESPPDFTLMSANLSLSENGNTLIVGLPRRSNNILQTPSGNIFVTKRANECTRTWTSIQDIVSDSSIPLGLNVFLTPNAQYLASCASVPGQILTLVYKFSKDTKKYELLQILPIFNPDPFFAFGDFLAVSDSACQIAVLDFENNIQFYQRIGVDGTYVAQVPLTAPEDEIFSQGLSLSGNGKVFVSCGLNTAFAYKIK